MRVLASYEAILRDISAGELYEFVVDRPFVPPGRELVFAKALLHGFEDDFASFVTMLVPQVENSLRHLLVLGGVHPYKQDADGVQDAWNLNRIMDDAVLEQILGPDEGVQSAWFTRFAIRL
jgi:hypothetical protein